MAGISSVSCPTSTTCEVVGSWDSSMGSSEVVGRSSNGGASWTDQTPRMGYPSTGLDSISCTSKLDCTAVGSVSSCVGPLGCRRNNLPVGGLVIRTSDGGSRWMGQVVPRTVRDLLSVWCVSTNDCQAIGLDGERDAVAIHTTNGGSSWSTGSFPSNTATLESVSCQSAKVCLAVGWHGGGPNQLFEVFRTSDGGVKWSSP
jgi:hypothetical protein